MDEQKEVFDFIVRRFTLGEDVFNVALAPGFYADDSGFDMAEYYEGMLIHLKKGVIHFTLLYADGKWEFEDQEALSQDMADKIGEIIVAGFTPTKVMDLPHKDNLN